MIQMKKIAHQMQDYYLKDHKNFLQFKKVANYRNFEEKQQNWLKKFRK